MAIIYGDNQIFESCRTALKNQMDALKSAMDTNGDDPRPAAIYDKHETVKMTLPAVSVGIVSVEKRNEIRAIKASTGSEIVTWYDVLCDIRVHTDFEDGYADLEKLARLLNSVNNWMETHRDLSSDINATEVNFQTVEMGPITLDDSFEESLTIGGKMHLAITITVSHTQA